MTDQRHMGREIATFSAYPESGLRQRPAQLPKKGVQRASRCFASGPQQMVVRPEAKPVKADCEWRDSHRSGRNRQIRQTRFRHIAEKCQGQVDGVAPGGPAAKRQGGIPSNLSQTICHFV